MINDSEFYGTYLFLNVVKIIESLINEGKTPTNGEITNEILSKKPEGMKISKSQLYRRIIRITEKLESDGKIKRIPVQNKKNSIQLLITEINA